MIELLVVISLIVILATMGMGMYKTSQIHAREAVLHQDLFHMRDAIDQYYADKGQYPAALDSLVSEGYLSKIPADPITNKKLQKLVYIAQGMALAMLHRALWDTEPLGARLHDRRR